MKKINVSIHDNSLRLRWVVVGAAASTGELAEEEKSDIGPLKEAEARALFWTQRIINTPISTASKALLEYVLPMPTVVTQLLFAIGCVLGVDGQQMRDKGGDISWNLVRQVLLCYITIIYDVCVVCAGADFKHCADIFTQ